MHAQKSASSSRPVIALMISGGRSWTPVGCIWGLSGPRAVCSVALFLSFSSVSLISLILLTVIPSSFLYGCSCVSLFVATKNE
ncbi:hypothetical protein [Pandoravirus japonicus]|uniref:Uncharacterized protein n=1 Tax=Pandoravirus japonicus TaxID=2823154 RepID=A0A811BRL4_9VIRU|nr:hypothetical protein [Pandoravirus japonicus]